MQNLSTLTTQTMSSLEIAELTGKEHPKVTADIRRILEEAGIEASGFRLPLKMPSGQTADTYNLPYRETQLVISGYSVPHRLVIIDRWQALENSQPKVPTNFIEAMQLATQTLIENERLAKQIEQDQPKVKFADIVTDSTNMRCVRVWVKAMKSDQNLRVGEREVFNWLVKKGYIYRENNGYLPYSKHESTGTGYFTVTVDEINGKAIRVLKITGKGVVALTGKVIEYFKPSNA